jgi:hypothetical protein
MHLRDRRFFFAVMVLCGGALLGLAFLVQQRDRERREAPGPEPTWHAAEHNADFFKSRLRPLVPSDSALVARIRARLRQTGPVFPAVDSLHLHVTRTLNSGEIFASENVLAWRPTQEGRELTWVVERNGRARARLRVRIRNGRLGIIEQETPGAPGSWQAWTEGADVPLALGDLPIGEVLALHRELMVDGLRPLGIAAELGATPQLVCESILVPTSAATTKPAIEAVRALAYIDSASASIQRIRVFDPGGYELRAYEDFEWESGVRGTPDLLGLRVTSMPSNSHTLLRRKRVPAGS